MVEGTSIFRPQTNLEKADFIEVGTQTNMDKFLTKLATLQQKYQKQHKPLCLHCARLDFEKKVKEIKDEAQTTGTASQVEGFDLNGLDKYGERDRFELVDIRTTREDKLLDGIRNTVTVGKQFVFKCKVRGCGISIFAQNDEIADTETANGIAKDLKII